MGLLRPGQVYSRSGRMGRIELGSEVENKQTKKTDLT